MMERTYPLSDAHHHKTGKPMGRSTMKGLVERGLLPSINAERIGCVLDMLSSPVSDVWSVTKIKGNPGALMSVVIKNNPQIMSDTKRKDAEKIVAISAEDLLSLVEAAAQAAGPGFATGKEMYARLARSGAPLDVTTRGLTPKSQPRLSIKDALSAQSAADTED